MAYTPLNYATDPNIPTYNNTNNAPGNGGPVPVGPAPGDMSRNNPLPGQSYFPEATKGLIQDQMGRDDAFYSGAMNHGVGNSGINTGGGSSDPMAQALENRYSAKTNQATDAIKTRNDLSAPLQTSQSEGKAVSEEAARYTNEVQNANQQLQYQAQRQNLYNQWQAMRARQDTTLVGQIFGGLASLGAGILGIKKGS